MEDGNQLGVAAFRADVVALRRLSGKELSWLERLQLGETTIRVLSMNSEDRVTQRRIAEGPEQARRRTLFEHLGANSLVSLSGDEDDRYPAGDSSISAEAPVQSSRAYRCRELGTLFDRRNRT
jgi:hypothetical protein